MVGLIVDGPGDYSAFKARFPNGVRILKADGPRGHGTTAEDIISMARKQVIMLADLGCRAAGIVTDFEKRREPYVRFLKKMEVEAANASFSIPVFIGSPNRMIENWYLADIEMLSKTKVFIIDKLKQKLYEGKNGKEELKKIFKPKYDYNEIKHGPQLFRLIRKTVAFRNSDSFKRFIKTIDKWLV